MKFSTKHFLHEISCAAISLSQKRKLLLFSFGFFLLLGAVQAQNTGRIPVSGIVRDSSGTGVAQATITEKGTRNATTTGSDGSFTINVANQRSTLIVSSVGYAPQEIRVGNQTSISVSLSQATTGLGEVVVIGYGTQKKGSLTGAISTVTSKDLDRVHAGTTVSTGLAGKIPGVTFRMSEGRPGASASIQIRNMGTPLYVIDGIQQDEGQFNNLAPNDIESITVLKDASAAIYGVRAANGVVVVTTKKGATGRNTVNVDAYSGWQTWFRFPDVLTNSYDYMRYKAEAEINSFGSTSITPAELDKYKQGASAGDQYRSFNWRKYILPHPAPQNQVNVNISGGSDKVNYYVSATNMFQSSFLGSEYKFNRSNIQSNVTAKLATGLRVGADINGRIETRQNPGVPGADDYFLSRLAILRNTPLERPFANDNPNYLNDLGQHLESNYAFLNYKLSGHFRSDWRVLQTNFHADWDIPGIKGLTARAVYSYYIADELENNQEYTYKAYTYKPDTKTYDVTGGSTNPWRDREQIKIENTTLQGQLNYNNTFGQHTIGATVVAERLSGKYLRNWIHASPISNNLPLIYFPTMDQYVDEQSGTARIGYIGRVTYSFANRYFVEGSMRRDASYLFDPAHRVGYFPGVSAGWRITDEDWVKQILGGKGILNDLKFRASYGILGDDAPNNNPIVAPYSYLPGYTYNQGTAIIGGNAVTVSRDKGIPVTRVSWLQSKISDVGADFSLLNRKLNGTIDYFYRKRTGLLASKTDVIVPQELGYSLPLENLNSDAQKGGEISLNYNTKIGPVNFVVGGNAAYSRAYNLQSYKPRFANSWDQYRNSQENRYAHIDWGYIVEGQFKSQEEINNWKVDVDGKGNKTLLPGDLKYKDVNGDGKIDQYDQRPIGYGYGTQPNINFGFTFGANYKNFDFNADFSGGAGYTWFQNWETRWAFQNNGNLNTIFEDRWHRTDPFDANSAWVPGKYPPNRYNPGHDHSDYGPNSSFWLHNVRQLRARTIQLGYSIPATVLQRAKIQRARVYINAYNLFSFDNLKQYHVDPEVTDDNGLQFPQSKVLNVGINISL